MKSLVIKLNQKETENLIEMIESHDDFLEKNEVMNYEELFEFTEGLLEQNLKYGELLKKIEFSL